MAFWRWDCASARCVHSAFATSFGKGGYVALFELSVSSPKICGLVLGSMPPVGRFFVCWHAICKGQSMGFRWMRSPDPEEKLENRVH